MAAPPPRPRRRRARRGSIERPINARMYRGTWLLVGIPLLVAAFSVNRASALPRPELPPTFDATAARLLADDLAERFPDRRPGTRTADAAAVWVAERFRLYGLRPRRECFSADVPGLETRALTNVSAVVPGRSDSTIVVLAHRDDVGTGRGANDNGSGTAALIELARTYARVGGGRPPVVPAHRIVFLSTDGGAFGALGAARFADAPANRARVAAVVALDAIAGPGAPRLVLAADRPASPPVDLVQTAATRVLEQTGHEPRHAGALSQLVDLGFPFSLPEPARSAQARPARPRRTAAAYLARPGPRAADRDPAVRLFRPEGHSRLGARARARRRGHPVRGSGRRSLRALPPAPDTPRAGPPELPQQADLLAARRRAVPRVRPPRRVARGSGTAAGALAGRRERLAARDGRRASGCARGPVAHIARPAAAAARGARGGGACRLHSGAARARHPGAARHRNERVRAPLPPADTPRVALAAAGPCPPRTRSLRGAAGGTRRATPHRVVPRRPRGLGRRRALVPRRADRSRLRRRELDRACPRRAGGRGAAGRAERPSVRPLPEVRRAPPARAPAGTRAAGRARTATQAR